MCVCVRASVRERACVCGGGGGHGVSLQGVFWK